jgi:hypothetical protein
MLPSVNTGAMQSAIIDAPVTQLVSFSLNNPEALNRG